METVRVNLGERSYDIVIGKGSLKGLGNALKGFSFTSVAVITNPTVNRLYGKALSSSLKKAGFRPILIEIPDGERYKTLKWMEHIWGELLKNRVDRKSAIIALGGGVVGDMAGFAAATYMRGIAYIQVPTTLLAQVDSSVGGKTGVNHPLGKNMIGAFYQPSLVWIDIDTLKSLPRRELLAGLAEVIKYGVIWDKAIFDYLRENQQSILGLKTAPLIYIVKRSCEIKAEVVSKDERESGLRAILNYGHTIGHAIETVTGYKKYLHGEAVAIGMCKEAELSSVIGLMKKSEAERVEELIGLYSLPTGMPKLDAAKVLGAMALDKKAVAGAVRFALPVKIGKARVNVQVEREAVNKSLRSIVTG